VYEKQGLISIQGLRALAAFAVVLAHIVGYEFERQLGLPNPLPGAQYGGAGVNLFFVVSGFVMVYASERLFRRTAGPQEFFLRRLARIAPLYWVTTSIVVTYLLLHYGSLQAVKFSPQAVIASYLFIPYPQADGFMAPVHGVGWTLNYEMFFYLCFCLALPLGRRRGVIAVTFLLTGLVVLNQVWQLTPPLDYLARPIILEFAMGMLVALVLREGHRLPGILSAVLVASGVAGFFLSPWYLSIGPLVIFPRKNGQG
jgi:peptidoglycan/LPS O-acetylase OafA/YrhL